MHSIWTDWLDWTVIISGVDRGRNKGIGRGASVRHTNKTPLSFLEMADKRNRKADRQVEFDKEKYENGCYQSTGGKPHTFSERYSFISTLRCCCKWRRCRHRRGQYKITVSNMWKWGRNTSISSRNWWMEWTKDMFTATDQRGCTFNEGKSSDRFYSSRSTMTVSINRSIVGIETRTRLVVSASLMAVCSSVSISLR